MSFCGIVLTFEQGFKLQLQSQLRHCPWYCSKLRQILVGVAADCNLKLSFEVFSTSESKIYVSPSILVPWLKIVIYFAGLLTAIHKKYLSIINYRELLFNDCGDRVAQLLHVRSVNPILQNQKDSVHQEFLIVNTHLLFPHDSSLSIVRLDQVCEFAAIHNYFFIQFFGIFQS